MVEYKEKEVKDIFREERVERIWVDLEVVFVEAITELVAVVVTPGEMEVGIKLFSVGEGEDLLTFGQIN